MEAIIQVMESTIGARDPYTVGHQQRVTQIACHLAGEMGLAEERIADIRVAGSLHDLGKIAVPTEILSRPGKLNDLEFAMVKTHPQVAFDILRPIKLPGHIDQIILQHHERLDGSGYPQGLKGREILLEARILGVADVIEAICSHRPYRPALGLAEALEEISQNRGVLYDEAVVETCLRLYGAQAVTDKKAATGMDAGLKEQQADSNPQDALEAPLGEPLSRTWLVPPATCAGLPAMTSVLGALIATSLLAMGLVGV